LRSLLNIFFLFCMRPKNISVQSCLVLHRKVYRQENTGKIRNHEAAWMHMNRKPMVMFFQNLGLQGQVCFKKLQEWIQPFYVLYILLDFLFTSFWNILLGMSIPPPPFVSLSHIWIEYLVLNELKTSVFESRNNEGWLSIFLLSTNTAAGIVRRRRRCEKGLCTNGPIRSSFCHIQNAPNIHYITFKRCLKSYD